MFQFFVTDGVNPDEDRVRFPLILALNRPPVRVEGAVLELVFLQGEISVPYALSEVITDPDGDAVSHELSIPADAPFQLSERSTADVPIFEGKTEASFGTGTVHLTALDGRGGVTDFELVVTIEGINIPPQILREGDPIPAGKEALPSQVIVSQGESKSFDLSPYAIDPDNFDGPSENDDTLRWATGSLVPRTTEIAVALAGEQLTLSAAERVTGTFSLRLTVSDGEAEDVALINITINAKPLFTLPAALPNDDFPDALLEDGAFTFDFAPYVSDVDNRVQQWEAEDNDFLGLAIAANGIATFIPKGNWHGTTTVTITAFDTAGASDSSEISITITPVPDPPILNLPAKGIEFAEDDAEAPSDVSRWSGDLVSLGWASDDDTAPSELQWAVDDSEHLQATVSGSTLIITAKDLDWHGTEEFTVRVTDQSQPNPLTVDGRLKATVTPVAERPRFIGKDTLTFQESPDTDLTVPLTGRLKWENLLADDDDPVEALRLEFVDGGSQIQVEIDTSNQALIFTASDRD